MVRAPPVAVMRPESGPGIRPQFVGNCCYPLDLPMDYQRLQSKTPEAPIRPMILVVDDQIDLRDAIAILLEVEGYDVIDAANGREALECLQTHPGHVVAIVLDLAMPVMDGWHFLTERRKDPMLSDIPTIVVTGISDAKHRQGELADVTVFGKPFHFDDLIRELRRALVEGKHTKANVV
jgi:CheY-like chemotaxis protein